MSFLTKSQGVQIWQTTLASAVRGGLYTEAVVRPFGPLFAVYGQYPDGSLSALVAKYVDERRAIDTANVVNSLAKLDPRQN